MADGRYEIGLIGLGVMGRNFLLNMADHGFSVAGYDLDGDKAEALAREKASGHDILPAGSLGELIASLRKPRVVMMLVPAGDPVDSVIADVSPRLETDDIIIDSGNSHFVDTNRRIDALSSKGLIFMGMGMSGGESGARHGPSLMPGGPSKGYERIKDLLDAVAAKVDGDPCVAYLGPGSAGHYVKMVHNGIEYGIMQLISETYDLMKRGLGMEPDELHAVYESWSRREPSGFLMEITAEIMSRKDDKTGNPLIDMILDRSKQKGTGKWTSQDAMNLQVPTPTIDSAVMMRNLSDRRAQDDSSGQSVDRLSSASQKDKELFISRLRNGMYASMILAYAQGMELLSAASNHYKYGLNLEAVARIWRGGCIIRAALLEDIRRAFSAQPKLENLMRDPHFRGEIEQRQEDLRRVVCQGIEMGVPVPALAASLAYFDAYRSDWLPHNLIQAQRDFFGSHTYERIDAEGTFHTQWRKEIG